MTPPIEPLAYESNQPASPPRLKCPKCSGLMEQGLIVELRESYWVAGEIKRGFLGNTRIPRGTKSSRFDAPVAGS